MNRSMRVGLAVVLGLVASGCGGKQHGGGDGDDGRLFNCKERSAEYIVVGSMAGEELGVALDCASAGPRVRRWRVEKDGTRDDAAKSLTPGEFDDVWARINDTGWHNLGDCGATKAGDPVYTFDVKDNQGKSSFACSGRGTLPFPYSTLVDELDQAAAAITGHAHDNPGLGE
jgi:hypothetical protein